MFLKHFVSFSAKNVETYAKINLNNIFCEHTKTKIFVSMLVLAMDQYFKERSKQNLTLTALPTHHHTVDMPELSRLQA
jgi:hypothetical protein